MGTHETSRGNGLSNQKAGFYPRSRGDDKFAFLVIDVGANELPSFEENPSGLSAKFDGGNSKPAVANS